MVLRGESLGLGKTPREIVVFGRSCGGEAMIKLMKPGQFHETRKILENIGLNHDEMVVQPFKSMIKTDDTMNMLIFMSFTMNK